MTTIKEAKKKEGLVELKSEKTMGGYYQKYFCIKDGDSITGLIKKID